MTAVADIIADIDRSIDSEAQAGRVLARTTDLLLNGGQYHADQLAVLGTVMKRFAAAAPVEGRVELAQRIASSDMAPPELLQSLVHDDAAVASPILSQSRVLAEQDLMAVALTRGRDHMLAICDRPEIGERVTELLVLRADPLVNCAVASNTGARFTPSSFAALIDQSRADERLQDLLGERDDLSDAQMQALIEASRESARRNLVDALSDRRGGRPVDRNASMAAARVGSRTLPNPAALSAMAHLDRVGFLTEAQLAIFAAEGRRDETIAAVSQMSGLAPDYVTRLFAQRDNDLLIVIGRARDWNWDTMLAMLRLRDPSLGDSPQLWRARELFRSMPSSTARQTIEFVKLRQDAVPPPVATPKLRIFKRA
jgi:uncharacterized protein (DUF2336 family)